MSHFSPSPLISLSAMFLVVLFLSSPAFALQPPDPGEIERLKQSGELPARLEHAKSLGNHLIDPYLLENALTKVRREVLHQQDMTPDRIEQKTPSYTPPPSRQGTPTIGAVKFFALLIDFSDYPSSNTKENVQSAMFGDGSLIPGNSVPYESLASYYDRASYNLLNLHGGTTLGWYRPSGYTRANMPLTTAAREQLIKDAINYFKTTLFQDFTQFDNNNDGTIDYFAVIWTGPDNGWSNFWWGYQTRFSDLTFTVDGKKLGKYSWQWEYRNSSYPVTDVRRYQGNYAPRTVIHETGHALGLPDYYDYDKTVGPNGGVGGLDMMDANWGDHNSFSKWVLDWITPTVVASGSLTKALSTSGTSKDAVLIMPGAISTDPFREFYIAQNRTRTGNDSTYPTDGMLIWHVDARLNSSATNYLYDNSYTSHKLLKLMQADGLERIENSSVIADAAMYYKSGKQFTPVSNPSSKDYAGIDTRVNVTGISSTAPLMSATFSIDAVSAMKILNIAKSGIGSGTVTSTVAGISCGEDCAESVPPGTLLTLNAVAAAGSRFTGWSGGDCFGAGSCTVTMASDITVTADFSTTLLLNENFDAKILPIGWTTVTSTQCGWWFNQSSNNTGGTGGYALGAKYSGAIQSNYDLELRSVILDAGSYDSVGLLFKNYMSANGTFDVDVSSNGVSGPWVNVWQAANTSGPSTVIVDISAVAAGHNNVILRFHHYGSWPWLQIDDVKVMASSSSSSLLTVSVGGGGTGTVISDPAGIICQAGSSCGASFSTPSNVILTATPGVYSTFGGWGGQWCSGYGICTVSMVAGKAVAATFNLAPLVKNRQTDIPYGSLQSAYNAEQTLDSHIIQARIDGSPLIENLLLLNKSKNVTVRGGYDAGFGSVVGRTTVQGAVTVVNGSARIDGIAIK